MRAVGMTLLRGWSGTECRAPTLSTLATSTPEILPWYPHTQKDVRRVDGLNGIGSVDCFSTRSIASDCLSFVDLGACRLCVTS